MTRSTGRTLYINPPTYEQIVLRGAVGMAPIIGKPRSLSLEAFERMRSSPDGLLPSHGVALRQSVRQHHLRRYADSCGLPTNTDLAPITYLYVMAHPLVMSLLLDASFPVSAAGVLHKSLKTSRYHAVECGDPLEIHANCSNLRSHRGNFLFDFDISFTGKEGDRVASQTSTLLIRGNQDQHQQARRAKQARGPLIGAGDELPGHVHDFDVRMSAIRRYSLVAGDLNPMHLHPLLGRVMGFGGAIAQGAWTAATMLRTLGGDVPERASYNVDFYAPVAVPSTLRVSSSTTAPGRWTLTAQSNDRVSTVGHVAPVEEVAQ